VCGLADERGPKWGSSPFTAIFAIFVSMTDDQFRTLVWYLRAIVLLLAIIALITFAYGGLPE
jgi:hypothetical protein